MAEPKFDSAEELIDAFGIRAIRDYERITALNDRKVGFSVQRKYPEDLLYVPLKKRNGEDDTFALIHVVYAHPTEQQDEYDSHKVPLIVRVTTHSRYLSNHIDFDFDDSESPTRESTERTKATPTPVPLDFYGEFFYDHHTNSFIDSTLEVLTGQELLERVYKSHCDTAHEKRGRTIRRKQTIQARLTDFLGSVVSWEKKVLNLFFGRTLDEGSSYFGYLEGYERKNLKKLSTESLDIFGYKASRSVIMLFCFLVVISYAIKYYFEASTPYIDSIFSKNFLAVTHSLIILWVLDVVIPLLLFHIINLTIRLRKYVGFRKFSI